VTDDLKDETGPAPDGGYIIDDSMLEPPTKEETREALKKLRAKDKDDEDE